jgi:hypothetical protein
MNNYAVKTEKIKLKDTKDITLEDIDTCLLGNFREPGNTRENIKFLEDTLANFSDLALDAYMDKDMESAKIYAYRCRKIKYTLEYYKKQDPKWTAVEQAKNYKRMMIDSSRRDSAEEAKKNIMEIDIIKTAKSEGGRDE